MSGNIIPRSILKAPLANGIGRHICQLQRITFSFCKTNMKSLEMRNFIDNYLVQFTTENPGIVVYVKPVRGKAPNIKAEYLNGFIEHKYIAHQKADIILRWVDSLRTRSGNGVLPIYKRWRTQFPSMQGIWHPELHKPFDAPKTPEEIIARLSELSMCTDEFPIAAQDELANRFEKQRRQQQMSLSD